MAKRSVFFISDGTGITAETLGHSLLTQFDQVEFDQTTIPYVDTAEKAEMVIERINRKCLESGEKPLIFATLVDPNIRMLFVNCKGLLLDFFNTFIKPLEKELNIRASDHVGRTHGMLNYAAYKTRIDAVNFALANDDGANVHNFMDANVVLVGVSRCGKTPTCLYLALQFGVFAANYPFTEDDMLKSHLPNFLVPCRKKLFGLSINAERLHSIRSERRPNSEYASLKQCQKEVRQVEELFRREKLSFLDTTTHSIEEISTRVLAKMGLKRQLF